MEYKLRLLNLRCYLSDESDGDEIYLKLDGKKVWPEGKGSQRITEEATTLNLDFKIQKGDKLELELWDHDVLSPDDHLGDLIISADAHGNYVNDFVKRGRDRSKYALEWEIG